MQIKRHHFDSIQSTNTWVKEQLDQFDLKALTLVTAAEQTGGRGRFHRQWISPKDLNIYATFLFFIPTLRTDLGNIPQLLALSAAESLSPLTDKVRMKWPNDLVIGNKKLGGILCEVGQSRDFWGVITGIGININMPESLLQTIDRPATSILSETGAQHEIDPLIEQLADQFKRHIQQFLKEGFEPFFETIRSRMVHRLNDPLRFSDFKKTHEGLYKGLNPDGSMDLLLPDGTLKRCVSGELL